MQLKHYISCASLMVCTACMPMKESSLPSSLRNLQNSYAAMSFGMTPNAAIDLMGAPKTDTENVILGVSSKELTWNDATQTKFKATFIEERLVSKSSIRD